MPVPIINMPITKHIFFSWVLLLFLFAPQNAHANTLEIGATCDRDSECKTDQCMGSSVAQYQDDFCVCNTADDCIDKYGLEQREVWECVKSTTDASLGLHYCKSNERVEYPINSSAPAANPFQTVLSARELEALQQAPVTKIRIPGIEFGEASVVTEDGDTYFRIPFLGEYIASIYKYAIAVAGIVSVLMIMIAGVQWVLSGGDQTRIASAKSRITGATVGLVIAVGSYTILYAVNPQLVAFKSLQVLYIEGEDIGLDKYNEQTYDGPTPRDLADQVVLPDSTASLIARNGDTAYGYNNISYFAQFDSRWGRIRYGADDSCSSYTEAACGPSSFAMILNHLGFQVNPTHVGKIAVETKARVCPGGTNSGNKNFIAEIEKNYKVKVEIFTDKQRALGLLRSGIPLITSSKQQGYTISGKPKAYKGHFMVYTGVEKKTVDGKEVEIIRVNDPGNRATKGITYMTMEQFELKDRFIYIHK
jgi:hypothetical protein